MFCHQVDHCLLDDVLVSYSRQNLWMVDLLRLIILFRFGHPGAFVPHSRPSWNGYTWVYHAWTRMTGIATFNVNAMNFERNLCSRFVFSSLFTSRMLKCNELELYLFNYWHPKFINLHAVGKVICIQNFQIINDISNYKNNYFKQIAKKVF